MPGGKAKVYTWTRASGSAFSSVTRPVMIPPRGSVMTTLSKDSPSFNSIDWPCSAQYIPDGLLAPYDIERYCEEY
jgi:hypothetical protein